MESVPLHLRAVPVISAGELLERSGALVVDLRSPAEFSVDHLPGAHNVPLLSNEGRALVGLLYKQHSPEEAFREGRELVLTRVQGLVNELAVLADWQAPAVDLAERVGQMTSGGIEAMEADLDTVPASIPERPVVLHCWRGGLRSRSVVALLRSLGLERAVGLEGGYRSYREGVMQALAGSRYPDAYVLRGLTGVGKTLVLRAMESIRPDWTVDLEGCAGHRSSLLGMVGLRPVSQKGFDSALARRLRAGFPGPVVYEGESRKVGDVVVPQSMWNSMQGAVNLQLVASQDRRVEVLLEDYLAREEARPLLRDQLERVEKRMTGCFELARLLDEGREGELVRLLLEHYYDPLYMRSEGSKLYAARFDASAPEDCAQAIVAWVEAQRATLA